MSQADLARDLVADVVALMNSNRAYVRKKAVLVLYKVPPRPAKNKRMLPSKPSSCRLCRRVQCCIGSVARAERCRTALLRGAGQEEADARRRPLAQIFLKFPDALRPSFPKLKEKLEDRDSSAVSCAVNVICELARKNPQNYLALAPLFFRLLTHTANNWMLIKIVKLLGALCPLEPRLGKKLVEPLTQLINTTPAKSLLYEAIHTVSVGMTPHLPIVQVRPAPTPRAVCPAATRRRFGEARARCARVTAPFGAARSCRCPPPRTKWTRRVHYPVLIGHAASLARSCRWKNSRASWRTRTRTSST